MYDDFKQRYSGIFGVADASNLLQSEFTQELAEKAIEALNEHEKRNGRKANYCLVKLSQQTLERFQRWGDKAKLEE